MTVYRIADCQYISDLTGKGAALHGGRWNSKDTYVAYTAQSPSLALLEAVVHFGKLPEAGCCLATIEIPDSSILTMPPENLPPGWHTHPPPLYLKSMGDKFIKANKFLAMAIPSVLMMEEYNYLLNPGHSLFKEVKILSQRPVKLDERLIPRVIH